MTSRTSRASRARNATLAMGLLALCVIILFAAIASSISFLSNPIINGGNTSVYKLTDLVCSWSPSADTIQANISWYNGSSLYSTQTDPAGNTSTLSHAFTRKGETWNCSVTLFNGTATTSASTTVTILNTQPHYPQLWNSTGGDIGNFTQITEDVTSNFTVNSSDDDNDPLLYYISTALDPSSSFCTIAGQAIKCHPIFYNQSGQHSLIVQVSDDGGISLIGKVFVFNVTPVNHPPIAQVSNQNILDNQVLAYNFLVTDEENALPFNYSIYNSSGLVGISVTNASPSQGRVAYTAKNDGSDVGNWTITINITDGGVANLPPASALASFILQVSSVNHPPNITSVLNPPIFQGQPLSVRINASDPDNDTISFSIASAGCPYPNFWNITTATDSGAGGTSRAHGDINVSATTNAHVVCRTVQISASDGKGGIDSRTITLNITNVNDPPTIWDLSFDPSNTLSNRNGNISNLSAFVNVAFSYRVNATDLDTLTYAGDSLTFSSNDSRFPLDPSTGVLSFTRNDSWVGNYSVLVNATDLAGASATALLRLQLFNNSFPYFLQPLANQTAQEGVLFTYQINATDVEDAVAGLNVSFSDNVLPALGSFFMNLTDGKISFTPEQTELGNYSVEVSVTDSAGATTTGAFSLRVNNTPDPPFITGINGLNGIVADHMSTMVFLAEDKDLLAPAPLSYEILVFTLNITGPNPTLLSVTANSTSGNRTTAFASFTPAASDVGNYSANLSVFDQDGFFTSMLFNFSVLNSSTPPSFLLVRPSRRAGQLTNFSFVNATYFSATNSTNINASENMSVVFDANVSFDPSFSQDITNLTFLWRLNGQIVANLTHPSGGATNLTRGYGFFSAANETITLTVIDSRYSSAVFTWNVEVDNVNRAPVLLNYLDNLTGGQSVEGDTIIPNYFNLYNNIQRFYDPDDDLNGDLKIQAQDGEATHLAFSNDGGCTGIATLTVTNTDGLRISPTSTGTCYVMFNASDGEYNVYSNNVTVNVTRISNGTTIQPVASSGGGSATTVVPIPLPVDVEVPKALSIITPKLVTIFRNQTLRIPVVIHNTWNGTLTDVVLSVTTNASNVTISIGKSSFPKMLQGEEQDTELVLTNYRTTDTYQIQVHANVSTPYFRDTATIYVNSLDYNTEGQAADSKVTFARDLLSSNPECIELNELLRQADDQIKQGRIVQGSRMVDSVINGCKYLLSIKSPLAEKPTNIVSQSRDVLTKVNTFLTSQKKNLPYAAIILGILVTLGVLRIISKGKGRGPAQGSGEAAGTSANVPKIIN